VLEKTKKFISRFTWAWRISKHNTGTYYCIELNDIRVDDEGRCTYQYKETANLESVSAQVVVDHVALDLVDRIEQHQFLDMVKHEVGNNEL